MGPYGARADAQPTPDRLVQHPLADRTQDLRLPGREPRPGRPVVPGQPEGVLGCGGQITPVQGADDLGESIQVVVLGEVGGGAASVVALMYAWSRTTVTTMT